MDDRDLQAMQESCVKPPNVPRPIVLSKFTEYSIKGGDYYTEFSIQTVEGTDLLKFRYGYGNILILPKSILINTELVKNILTQIMGAGELHEAGLDNRLEQLIEFYVNDTTL